MERKLPAAIDASLPYLRQYRLTPALQHVTRPYDLVVAFVPGDTSICQYVLPAEFGGVTLHDALEFEEDVEVIDWLERHLLDGNRANPSSSVFRESPSTASSLPNDAQGRDVVKRDVEDRRRSHGLDAHRRKLERKLRRRR